MRRMLNGTVAACLIVCLLGVITWKGSAKPHRLHEPPASAERVENVYLPDEKAQLREIVQSALGKMEHDSDLDKVKKILKHQASFAKFESCKYVTTKQQYRAWIIYRNMRLGNIGYMCNGHADMFLGILEIYGVPGRRIIGESVDASHPAYADQIKSGRYASHSAVEVKIDGRWILADPSFFALPKYQGNYISLQQGLEILNNDPAAQFEFDTIADRYPIEAY